MINIVGDCDARVDVRGMKMSPNYEKAKCEQFSGGCNVAGTSMDYNASYKNFNVCPLQASSSNQAGLSSLFGALGAPFLPSLFSGYLPPVHQVSPVTESEYGRQDWTSEEI